MTCTEDLSDLVAWRLSTLLFSLMENCDTGVCVKYLAGYTGTVLFQQPRL